MNVAEDLLALLDEDFATMRTWATRATTEATDRRRRVRALAERVQEKGDALAAATTGITVEAVRARLTAGAALSLRERRFVVLNWPLFRSHLLDVVGNDVGLTLLLRRGLFQQHRQYTSADASLLQHIARVEQQAQDFLGGTPLPAWKNAQAIGVRLAQSAPASWDDQLAAMGLRPSWDYAVLARGSAFSVWLQQQPSVSMALCSVQATASTALRYLPPPERAPDGDRFFSADWETIVGAWLQAAAAQPDEAAVVDVMLLESVLRDPLSSQGHRARWESLQKAFPHGYAALCTRLSRSDIEFFFQEAQGSDAQERGHYWLRYLGRVRQTMSFLSRPDREAARAHLLRASNPSHDLALKRAGTVGGDASVFVLWFDNVVVVEFSKTGNATYVYSRAAFEHMRAVWGQRTASSAASFKDKELALTTLSHITSWQYRFTDELRRHGVVR